MFKYDKEPMMNSRASFCLGKTDLCPAFIHDTLLILHTSHFSSSISPLENINMMNLQIKKTHKKQHLIKLAFSYSNAKFQQEAQTKSLLDSRFMHQF